MKRITFFLLILLLMLFPLSAGKGGSSVSKVLATHEITAELNSTTDMSSFDIGYSTNQVINWGTLPARITDTGISLKAVLDDKGVIRAKSDQITGNGIYVYWMLYTYDTVKLELSISGPLKNTAMETLDWTVEWIYTNTATGVPVEEKQKLDSANLHNGPLPVTVYPAPVILTGVAGSVPLTISTADLLGKSTVTDYKGNLIMTISIVK